MTDKPYNHAAETPEETIARLKAWVADLQSGMYVNCVYCGHRYGPADGTPVALADVLKEHVEHCPEHPAMKAMRALENLRRVVKGMSEGKKWDVLFLDETVAKTPTWQVVPADDPLSTVCVLAPMRDPAELEATARLIAQAPELRESLLEIAEWMESHDINEFDEEGHPLERANRLLGRKGK